MLVKSLRLSIIILLSLLGASASRAQTPVIGQPCPASGQTGITAQGTPVICTQVPGGGALVWTATGGSPTSSGAGGNGIPQGVISPLCNGGLPGVGTTGVGLKCAFVYDDGRYITDASTTNTSSTVTLPNSDGNFTSADVGKVAWVWNPATATIICPQTTIATVKIGRAHV